MKFSLTIQPCTPHKTCTSIWHRNTQTGDLMPCGIQHNYDWKNSFPLSSDVAQYWLLQLSKIGYNETIKPLHAWAARCPMKASGHQWHKAVLCPVLHSSPANYTNIRQHNTHTHNCEIGPSPFSSHMLSNTSNSSPQQSFPEAKSLPWSSPCEASSCTVLTTQMKRGIKDLKVTCSTQWNPFYHHPKKQEEENGS